MARRTAIFDRFPMARLHWLLVLLICAIVGCDRGPKLVPAGGIVKYKNAAIPGADVVFVPDGDGQAAIGRTDEQGQFKMAWIGVGIDTDRPGASSL